MAKKVVVIITTIENANFTVQASREDQNYIEYGIKVSRKKIEKHIQNTLISYVGRQSIGRFFLIKQSHSPKY